MIAITTRLPAGRAADAQLVLPFELRKRSRLRATLSNGEDVGLFLDRGTVLRDGDLLLADDGRVVQIVAAAETVSTVSSADAQALLRASYHLGNRHVSLQIGQGWLRYLHDHVLDEMVRRLGLAVKVEQAPFEPEAGAYGGGHHGPDHGHDHGHDHEQDHEHEHEHEHGAERRHRHHHG